MSTLIALVLLASGVATVIGTVLGQLQLRVGTPLAAALVVLGALTTQLERVQRFVGARLEQRTRQRSAELDRRRELEDLVAYLGPFDQADPIVLGIARSHILERAEQARGRPLYVKRTVQVELDEHLRNREQFVVVRGEAAAGKSRTAREALLAAGLGNRVVVVPNRDTLDRHHLSRTLNLLRADELGDPPALLWLDDLHQYLNCGALTRNVLSRLSQRQTIIVATIREAEYRRLLTGRAEETSHTLPLDQAREARRTLQIGYDVELPSRLHSQTEQAQATEFFGAHDWNREGLGAVLILARELIRWFTSGSDPQTALVCAVVDWQRTGVRRPIERSQLEDLWQSHLQPRLRRLPTADEFNGALSWATTVVEESDTALLYLRDEQGYTFEAHDYVVAYRDGQGKRGPHQEDVPAEIWKRVIEETSTEEVSSVGIEAFNRGRLKIALDAWDKAANSVDPFTAATALSNKGSVLFHLGYLEQAVEVYAQVEQASGKDPKAELREPLAKALVSSGWALYQLGHLEQAIEVWGQVEQRFGGDPLPALREPVAMALVNRAWAIGQLRGWGQAIEVCENIERRFGSDPLPSLRDPLASALVIKGYVLSQVGQFDEAIHAFEEVESRFGQDPLPPLRESLANALGNKGWALGQLGRTEQAIEACEEVERRFGQDPLPSVHEPVSGTLVVKALILLQQGRAEQAIEVSEEIGRRFGDEPPPVIRVQLARALLVKAQALHQLVGAERALEVYEHIERHFGSDPVPGLREPLATALVMKGAALVEMGDLNQAMAALEQVEQRFNMTPMSALLSTLAEALITKAVVLEKQGRSAQAIEMYEQVEQRFGETSDWTLRLQLTKAGTNRRALLDQHQHPAAPS